MITRFSNINDAYKIKAMNVDKDNMKQFIDNFNYFSETNGVSWTVEDEADGEIIAMAGMILTYDDRVLGWSIQGERAPKNMLYITREIIKTLNNVDVGLVEIAVKKDFEQGHRWAKILGFKLQELKINEDKENLYLYER
jgi:hypothetical protein